MEPAPRPLVMLGLGGSIGTPPGGIEADAMIVSSFSDLEARADEARGRIVVFNAIFASYGETGQYRTNGPSRAARHGAVAALVRAIGPTGLRTPHTGALRYSEGVREIPAAAISTEDADALARLAERGVRIRLRLQMEAQTLPDVASANVVGELRGRERPDEIVVVGGHLDSWDVGTGASDYAVGCIVTWEAVRLMKQLGLVPRRTVRVVLFTNEENGLRGGLAYRDAHRDGLARHAMMLESDSGVFSPISVGFSGSDRGRDMVREIMTLVGGLAIGRVSPQGGGADIGPSVETANIPSLSINGNPERYFQIHHTPADTVDRIDPVEVARATAVIAVLSYVIAELPERLGFSGETAAGAR
jgi:carboxypeptidase Q